MKDFISNKLNDVDTWYCKFECRLFSNNVELTAKKVEGIAVNGYTTFLQGQNATAQDLKNSIDNLQIGGRNLILNSKESRSVFNETKIERYINYDIASGALEPNTEYTLTWEYLTSNNFLPSVAVFVSDVKDHRYIINVLATYNTFIKKSWTFKTSTNPNQKGFIS